MFTAGFIILAIIAVFMLVIAGMLLSEESGGFFPFLLVGIVAIAVSGMLVVMASSDGMPGSGFPHLSPDGYLSDGAWYQLLADVEDERGYYVLVKNGAEDVMALRYSEKVEIPKEFIYVSGGSPPFRSIGRK